MRDVIGDKNYPGIIPVSRSSWSVRSGCVKMGLGWSFEIKTVCD